MSNVILSNYTPSAPLNYFSVIWKLTRILKKAGWKYLSSGDGYTKDTSANGAFDRWGSNTDPNTDTYASISTYVTSATSLPTATITVNSTSPIGVNTTSPAGISFPTNGTIMILTSTNGWQTVSYTGITANTFTGCTGGSGTVPLNSQVSLNAISLDVTGAWWNAQGPSTLKIPITSAQVAGQNGNFIHGENLTQTTSKAQGEFLGYLFDPSPAVGGGPSGYLVVQPRVDGYGADPHGWDHTHIITGAISGATVTPSATIIEFVREIVLWKDPSTATAGITAGSIYYQCVDGYAESSSRYSVLATSTGCTASVAPGGGGTNNSFPTNGSFVVGGTGGVTPATAWFLSGNTANSLGRIHIMATSATYASMASADGSFTTAVGYPSFSSGAFIGHMFTRVDFQEDGDVDPYVWYAPDGTALPTTASAVATLRTASTTTISNNNFWDVGSVGANDTFFKFWRRRGRGDANDLYAVGTYSMFGLIGQASGGASGEVIPQNIGDREKVANTFNNYYALEDVWCLSFLAGGRTRKGSCRWLKAVNGGVGCNTYANKTWIQLSNMSTNTSTPTAGLAFVVGPWDGITVPVQA